MTIAPNVFNNNNNDNDNDNGRQKTDASKRNNYHDNTNNNNNNSDIIKINHSTFTRKIKLSSIVTALLLATLLISTSTISMPQIFGQVEQNMTKNMTNYSSGNPLQNFPQEKELTANDVKGSNLVLLQSVNNSIEILKKSQPTVSFNSNTTHIEQLIKTGQLKEAIAELENLQADVTKAFGQEAANKQFVFQIENLIGVLKKQI